MGRLNQYQGENYIQPIPKVCFGNRQCVSLHNLKEQNLSSHRPSITTTVQGGMSGDVRRAARRLAWERLARSLHSCVSSSQRSSSFGPNRSRGSISRTTR